MKNPELFSTEFLESFEEMFLPQDPEDDADIVTRLQRVKTSNVLQLLQYSSGSLSSEYCRIIVTH